MFVVLVIQHAKRMPVLYRQLFCFTHKHLEFVKICIENKVCVLTFSTIFFSETLLILRRNEKDVIIDILKSPGKVPLFFSDCKELEFSQNISETC